MRRSIILAAAIPFAIATLPVLAAAPHQPPRYHAARSGARGDALEQVSEATAVLARMKREPGMQRLLREARGVLIFPDYGRAGLVVGGGGGSAVLMARNHGRWTGPALYNFGTVNIGAQAGGSGGSAAMLIMSDRALRRFEGGDRFSVNADAGLTIVKYSARGHAQPGDVVLWSDLEGAYAGATVGVTDLDFDEGETAALYGHRVNPRDVFSGSVHAAQADSLIHMLPG